MATTIALREALNLGISSGNFIDTKIILYSRRDSSGRVCRPRALYANSHVLKKVPHFQDCEDTAAFIILREPHVVVLKRSSGISQSPSQETLQTRSTKKNLRKTTGTFQTVTLRTMKMRWSPRSTTQASPTPTNTVRSQFLMMVIVAKTRRSTPKRGRF